MPNAKKNGKQSQRKTQKQTPEPMRLLQIELGEIYSAESQLSRALPRLSKAVDSESVRELFDRRLEQGRSLVEDIDRIFEEMEASPPRKKNIVAEALINDAQDNVQEFPRGPALDAVLIGAMQKTEHYCIAAWGATRAFAEAMQLESAAQAMQRAIDEGEALDEELTEIAETELYPTLLGGAEDEDEDDDEDDEMDADDAQSARSGRNQDSQPRR